MRVQVKVFSEISGQGIGILEGISYFDEFPECNIVRMPHQGTEVSEADLIFRQGEGEGEGVPGEILSKGEFPLQVNQVGILLLPIKRSTEGKPRRAAERVVHTRLKAKTFAE